MKWLLYILSYAMLLLFGEITILFYTLILLVIIDYATGLAKAVYTKSISSEVGSKGIIRKVMIFVIIAVSNIVDNSLNFSSLCVKDISILFYISNEIVSIIENAIEMNVPVPNKIKEIFSRFKNIK